MDPRQTPSGNQAARHEVPFSFRFLFACLLFIDVVFQMENRNPFYIREGYIACFFCEFIGLGLGLIFVVHGSFKMGHSVYIIVLA